MKTQEQFLADSNKSPNCNSGDTQYGQIEVMMDGAVQLVTCGQCGAGWEEMYKLVSYEITHDPVTPEELEELKNFESLSEQEGVDFLSESLDLDDDLMDDEGWRWDDD
jgi:hypothetical protein